MSFWLIRTPLIILLSVLWSCCDLAFADDDPLNRVPNPGFEGANGTVAGNVNGVVPDFWRGFGVGDGEISLETVPLVANVLYPGSPPLNALKLTVVNFNGGGQGFDHEVVPFTFTPDHDYAVEVYMRSNNSGGADQGVAVAFPVFDGTGFTGRAPGSFDATVTKTWKKYTGPAFMEAQGTAGDIAFRLNDDGGENSILIAMPTVRGPAFEVPQVDYPPVFTPGRNFSPTDPYVSTQVFQWFNIFAGQKTGPWRPEDGRDTWTGEMPFWRAQIKDIMDANIDVIYVHLIDGFSFQREQLFRALSQLRAEGYDTPYVVPFLDPLILWNSAAIDMSTKAGKDAYVGKYRNWFKQYFRHNTDAHAESRILHIDGKVVLNTWHNNPGFTNNMASYTRNDVESRLATFFGTQYPDFMNGVYQIGTSHGIAPPFADEIAHQFSNTEHFSTNVAKGKRIATMKPGYWDQNVRVPGSFLPRNGGADYWQGWDDLIATKNGGAGKLPIHHVFVESWNEYDEGTGVYAGDPGAPFIAPKNQSGNTDTWSDTDNPREYIDSTYMGASAFNDIPDLDSLFLWNDIPSEMQAGETIETRILVRNTGDLKWSDNAGIELGQHDTDPDILGSARQGLDAETNEVTRYGGVFRGRPVLYKFMITAPVVPGDYEFNYQMLQADTAVKQASQPQAVDNWFGDILTFNVTVNAATGPPGLAHTRRFLSFDDDGKADLLLRNMNSGQWQINFMNWRQVLPKSGPTALFTHQNWETMGSGDFNANGRGDVLVRQKVTGAWNIFLMNGRNRTSGPVEIMKDLDWIIAAIDDFNGNGRDDVLLRNSVTGRWHISFLNFRAVHRRSGQAEIFINKNWEFMGTGDFSGNGRGDVLLRHKTLGSWTIFMMNGRRSNNGETKLSRDQNWKIAAIDDFDGDGKDDIMLRHSVTGRWQLNFMNFRAVRPDSGSVPLFANQVWEIMGSGDFNGNKRADILLRHGVLGTWNTFIMNGRQVTGGATRLSNDLNWKVQ